MRISNAMTKSVAFHTLGCKLNFSETSTLSRLLEADGFVKTGFEEAADVYVINTCSVTENADKECRQIVRRIRRRAPGSSIVVTGCYAQLKPEEIAGIEGVDLVLGAAEKFNIVEHLKGLTKGDPTRICSCDIDDIQDFRSAYSLHDRTRSFLKVQDGCDYTCSYCTIPLARGRSRSDRIGNVVSNAEKLAQEGVKEIVLTGVNIGDFGKGTGDNKKKEETFLQLITALDEVEGIERYRISSIEPNLLNNDVISFVADSKRFMPHFHIPLQSGSNRILGLMRRRYRRELYSDRVATIREKIPHACIGVDVIVGFPSESEDDFEETYHYLHALDVSYLHVFTYSERNDTDAIRIIPSVPVHIRHERNKVLRNLSYKKMKYFAEQHHGQTRPVLFEGRNRQGAMEGYTDNYIKVTAAYDPEKINQLTYWML